MGASSAVQWGILGTGSINERFLRHVREAPDAEFVAVGSRTPERAAEFASRYGIPRSFGSYEEMLADPAIEAVYICLPNSLHHHWTMQALAAGKHVLCEKPYSRRASDVVEAFDAAEASGLLLMEGFMWRHTPQARRFMEVLPEIGPIRAIHASFSFRLEDPADVRMQADLDGGSPMDVGCYCISGSRMVAGSDPERVYGEQVTPTGGVDVRFTGVLGFGDGLTSTIVSGFQSDHASLEAIGRDGALLLREPWTARPPAMWLGDLKIPIEPEDPYRLEVENFSAAIRGHGRPLLGRADALGQAQTIEALYRSAATGAPVMLDSPLGVRA